jgi:NAD(P)-dependent dehydrogenase (short-subunit alcohol dehydrogenase family)
MGAIKGRSWCSPTYIVRRRTTWTFSISPVGLPSSSAATAGSAWAWRRPSPRAWAAVMIAGRSIGKRPDKLALVEWNELLATNLTGLCCGPGRLSRNEGSGRRQDHQHRLDVFDLRRSPAAAYGASKGALIQLTKSLATAWAADNLQVNAVLPGRIDTDLSRGACEREPALRANALRRTPAGRCGTPHDLAGVAVFLASAASDFVTGAAIPVDGGFADPRLIEIPLPLAARLSALALTAKWLSVRSLLYNAPVSTIGGERQTDVPKRRSS